MVPGETFVGGGVSFRGDEMGEALALISRGPGVFAEVITRAGNAAAVLVAQLFDVAFAVPGGVDGVSAFCAEIEAAGFGRLRGVWSEVG